ncbi:MAG: ABC transporter permease [Chloroflexi bacterium]|nr:ABC transporter permease [Chloroflexota bacterium]
MAPTRAIELPKANLMASQIWLAKGAVHLVRRKPLGAIGAAFVLLMLLVGIFAPLLATHDPIEANASIRLLSPNATYPLGTDNYGFDIYSRVIWGARVSMTVASLATGLTVLLVLLVGVSTGYFGGWWDMAVQRIVDTALAFPGLLIMLAMIMLMGTSMASLIITLGIILGIRYSRVVRAAVLSIKELQYFESALAVGCSRLRIITYYILPNIFGPVMVIATLNWGNIVIMESNLSFLGFGVPPPDPSWGRMVSEEARPFFERAPWMALFPGIAISLTVFGFNMLGDALRDLLDPRLR